MEYYPFDSKKQLYKSIFGAVASEEKLTLRLLLHKDAHVHEAFLILKDDTKTQDKQIKLEPKEFLEDYRFYDCELTLNEGLYWYKFRYTSDYGEFFVTKINSVGVVSKEGLPWQLTVYNKIFTTPDWIKGGIIYQIFPDRFYASKAKKSNVPVDRFLCNDWNKIPEHKQNNGICSLGNDYYGGDLVGIIEKLPYLKELGVSCIYLNPIFEAHSNHRYNTADYKKIDPLLGDEKDFSRLCKKAKELNIRIILDGVFSHTGDDSIYFNRKNRYKEIGAYNSKNSEYFSWYKFKNWPDDYNAWWDVPSLPEIEENNEQFTDFITGKNGILRKWLKAGADGWRLDVADELPDEFLDNARNAIKSEKKDAYLLGEVWEDATNKISYGERRRFLRGSQLDSVMNYPFANAIVDFILWGDAAKFIDTIENIVENYPPCCLHTLMNHIGTHDTPRILTRLGTRDNLQGDREWQSKQHLTDHQYNTAIRLTKLAVALQFTLPGVPSVYYGDETGLEGWGDPFCRGTIKWDSINNDLLGFYKSIGQFRSNCSIFTDGKFIPIYNQNRCVAYIRKKADDICFVSVNVGENDIFFPLPFECDIEESLYGNVPKDGWIAVGKQNICIFKGKIKP